MPWPSNADRISRAFGLLLLVLPLGCGESATPAERPPNFLVIIADDLGQEEVGLYAPTAEARRTPNIDRLGREGLVFEHFWSMPACSPSRAALLTGEYPSRNGIGYNVIRDPVSVSGEERVRFGLPDTAFTLPRALALAGYTSAIVGKWHLAVFDQAGTHPLRAGFDHHRGSLANLGPGYFRWFKLVDGAAEVAEVYATTDTTNDAIALAETLAEPWLIVVSYNAPHAPAHVPPQELHGFGEFDPEKRPDLAFRAMVEAMDREVGRLVAETASQEPFVLFLGDNGTPTWARLGSGDRRRGKGTVFEAGVLVPFVVNHPSIVEPGRRVNGLAGVTDIFATLVELAAAKVEPGRMPRDSISLAPLLRSAAGPAPRRWLFTESFWPNGPGPKQRRAQAVRDARYKLVRIEGRADQLYDLIEDPGETRPLRARAGEEAAARVRLADLADELPAASRSAP